MPQSWTCDACGWSNLQELLCGQCGQALHYQQDPPLDVPRQPEPALLPEFWSLLLWTFIAVAGSALYLPPLAELTGIAGWWLLLHLLVFGSASLAALRNLVFARTFQRLELAVPAHARSGTMIPVVLKLLPYETVSGVHASLILREFWFDRRGRLRSRRHASVELNRGAPLRGRRLHEFRWDFPAPVPDRRYQHLPNEMRLSAYRALGRLVPELGLATAQLRPDGGWYVQLRLRRGPFLKVKESRVVLYAQGARLLVG